MLGPSSVGVVVVLLLVAGGLLGLAVRRSRRLIRVPAALIALLLPFLAGIAAVNTQYAYYRTWSDVADGLFGSGPPQLTGVQAHDGAAGAVDKLTGMPGKVLTLALPGPVSGVSGRSGLVYVPPELGDPGLRTDDVPVVELFHGTPGRPSDWTDGLHLQQTMDRLRAARQVGPMVLVVPDTNGGVKGTEECTDAPGGVRDDTYLTRDVPADVRSALGLHTGPRSSGLLGYSSGGYCAMNLGLRHRTEFRALAALDGYYSPTQAPYGARLFHGDLAAQQANDPTLLVRAPDPAPLPAIFLATGTGDRSDLRAARSFLAALGPGVSAQLVTEPGARHTFDAWASSLPVALTWMWQQLRTPDLVRAYPGATDPPLPSVVTVPHHGRHSGAPSPVGPGASAPGTARHHVRSAPLAPSTA